jgi:hypothetical protein
MDPHRTLDPMRSIVATAGEIASYSLGSRPRDLVAVGLLTLLVLVSSPALRVYHRVTVMDLSVVRIESDGRRSPEPAPSAIWNAGARVSAAHRPPGKTIDALKRQIDGVMRDDPLRAALAPGGRIEWIIRYSENNTRLDHTVVLSYPASSNVSP